MPKGSQRRRVETGCWRRKNGGGDRAGKSELCIFLQIKALYVPQNGNLWPHFGRLGRSQELKQLRIVGAVSYHFQAGNRYESCVCVTWLTLQSLLQPNVLATSNSRWLSQTFCGCFTQFTGKSSCYCKGGQHFPFLSQVSFLPHQNVKYNLHLIPHLIFKCSITLLLFVY